VSTRKLILASLVCGLLILVAGTVKLLQTSSDGGDVPAVLPLGEVVSIGMVSVTVNAIEVTNKSTMVNVSMTGLADGSPLAGWSMLANGEITQPVKPGDCPSTADDVTCTVEFVVAVGTPTIVYARDGEKRQWLGS
jgi:hypothetical protein